MGILYTTSGQIQEARRSTFVKPQTSIAGSGSTSWTFTVPEGNDAFNVEVTIAGRYSASAVNSKKWANSYGLASNVEQDDNQVVVYSTGGEAASLTMSIAAVGANNQITITISNADASLFGGSVKFEFLGWKNYITEV